jgi:alpha-beta hydrolase superfamily lysophospholipase
MTVPTFPGPAEARHEEGFVTARDGTRIHWDRYTPSQPRSTVMVLHGAGDHSGRYAGLTAALVRDGHEVALLDFRGHGRSEGKRWFVERFEDYLADLDAFAAHVRSFAGGRKRFVVAHSQGGHIAAHWALAGGRDVDGYVLSSPYFRLAVKPPAVKTWASLVVGKVVPHLPVNAGLSLAELTSDPEMQRWTDEDPLYQRKVTPGWFIASGKAQERLQSRMKEFDRPLLLLLGTADRIADPEAGRSFAAAARSRDKQVVEYPGLKHEIFNERVRGQVLADVVDWIDARVGPKTN